MSQLTCERVDELAAAYALGALDPHEASLVRSHLQSCQASGHSEVADALALRAAVAAGSTEPVQPRPGLRQKVLASAAASQQAPPADVPARGAFHVPPGAASPAPAWRTAAGRTWLEPRVALPFAALAIGAVVVLGLLSLDLVNRLAEQSALLDRVAAALAAGGEVTRVETEHGDGYLIRRNGELTLVAADVPEAPLGSLYEMWLIPAEGQPRPAGTYTSSDAGIVVATAVGDAADATTFAVTIEQGVVQQPTSDPVIAVPVP